MCECQTSPQATTILQTSTPPSVAAHGLSGAALPTGWNPLALCVSHSVRQEKLWTICTTILQLTCSYSFTFVYRLELEVNPFTYVLAIPKGVIGCHRSHCPRPKRTDGAAREEVLACYCARRTCTYCFKPKRSTKTNEWQRKLQPCFSWPRPIIASYNAICPMCKRQLVDVFIAEVPYSKRDAQTLEEKAYDAARLSMTTEAACTKRYRARAATPAHCSPL